MFLAITSKVGERPKAQVRLGTMTKDENHAISKTDKYLDLSAMPPGGETLAKL